MEKARKDRAARMKLAKGEADKEIEAYRKEQDLKLEEILAKQDGSEGAVSEKSLQKAADEEVAKMKANVQQNASKVVDMLLEVVMKVDMKVPDARKSIRGDM